MYRLQQQQQQQQQQAVQQQQQHSKRSESSDEDQFNQLLKERLQVKSANQGAEQGSVGVMQGVTEVVNQEQLIVFSDSDTNVNQNNHMYLESKVKKKPPGPVPHKPPKPQRNVSIIQTTFERYNSFILIGIRS